MPPNTTGQSDTAENPRRSEAQEVCFIGPFAGAIKVGPRKFSPFSRAVRQARLLRGFSDKR